MVSKCLIFCTGEMSKILALFFVLIAGCYFDLIDG